MKLLNNIPTVIEEEQLKSLIDFAMKQGDLNKIIWNTAIDDIMKNFENLNFEKIPGLDKFDFRSWKRQLESIIVNIVALLKEDGEIKSTLAVHEMLRKDEVKTINDNINKTLDLIQGNSERSYKMNTLVKNGILRLFPEKVEIYNPQRIYIKYTPGNLVYITGNTPSNKQIKSGTYSGYWKSNIYTALKSDVSAIIRLEYDSNILINNVNLRAATTYPVRIQDIQYYDPADSENTPISIAGDYDETVAKKDFFITLDEPIRTNKIDIHVVQDHYDFIWEEEVDDITVIQDFIINGDDLKIIQDKRVKNYIDTGEVKLIDRQTIYNKYKYEIGAYNIECLYKRYNNNEGVFRTEEYVYGKLIDNMEINSSIITDGNIVFRAIQDDNSYVEFDDYLTALPVSPVLYQRYKDGDDIKEWNGTEWIVRSKYDLPLDKIMKIEKATVNRETITVPITSFIEYSAELTNIPIYNETDKKIIIRVNGDIAVKVDEFTSENRWEYIVVSDKLFFNKDVRGYSIDAHYWKLTKSIILEIIMNQWGSGYTFKSPGIDILTLKINNEVMI